MSHRHQHDPSVLLPTALSLSLLEIVTTPLSRLMTRSLDRLPFDILFYIASSLHLDDVVHLGQTCRQLKAFLDEGTLQRSIVEVTYAQSEDVDLTKTSCRIYPTPRRRSLLEQAVSAIRKRYIPFTIAGMHFRTHTRFLHVHLGKETTFSIVKVYYAS